MLHRIFGANGSGKNEYMLKQLGKAVSEGKICFWIAPEQQSLAAEKRICEALGDRGTLNCEVLNFERLPNRIARTEGGLTASTTDAGARNLLMSLALTDIKDQLGYYGNSCSDISFIKNCVTAVSRFKAEGITPERLREASESDTLGDIGLKQKLYDLSLISEKYDSFFKDGRIDPYDSLTLLAESLKESSFFDGCAVFVDGYYTFTYQEYSVLQRIIASCDDCYISFVADSRSLFEDNRRAADRIAEMSGRYEDIVMPESTRGRSACLRHIEKFLWENEYTALPSDGSIRLIAAENIFEECEAVASEILDAVRGGMRYRDICVLMPDASAYGDILESTLRFSGIPCFASHKENVVSKPVFAFILACIEVAYSNFSMQSVRKYLKSGYAGLSTEECDLLLRYVEMWGIRGQKAYDGSDWLMNPDGYGDMNTSGEKMLLLINGAKRKISAVLSPLRDTLTSDSMTVGTAAKALYEHMVMLNIPAILAEKAERMALSGDSDGALREKQLMDIAVSIFDKLYTLASDRHISLKQLADMIESMANEYSVGSIPSSSDAVATGDPRLFRGDGCKLVIICGVNDGVFPSYGKGGSFFSESELISLEGEGINLAVSGDAYIRRERFLFYMACTSASQRLVLTYPKGGITGGNKRPSLGFLRVNELIEGMETRDFGKEESDFIYSLPTAISRYPSVKDESLKEAVEESLKKFGVNTDKNSAPIFDAEAEISFEKPFVMGISPSAFERYVYCPFSYFASRLMRLKKRDRIRFAYAQTGTLIHKALEEYMRFCTKGGTFIPMDAKQMNSEAERIVSEYFPAADDRRFARLCGSFRRTLVGLYKNLSAEFGVCSFMPVGFEVKIGMGADSKKPLSIKVDGTDVYIRGIVDRVDSVEIDGQKYIRITDYKSGGKTFNMDLIDAGLDMQMPMYLFSLCESDKALPAGCMYYTAKLSYVDRIAGESDAELEKRIQKEIKRSGIYSDKIPLVLAADPSDEGLFRPVRITKQGEIYKGDASKLLSDEQFEELKQKLGDKLCNVAESIFKGNMNIAPKHIDQSHDACKYCDYRGACRYDGRH